MREVHTKPRGLHACLEVKTADLLGNDAGIGHAIDQSMKLHYSNPRNRALTLIEVLAIIFVLFIAAIVLLPSTHASYQKALQSECVNNLRQVGLVYRLWATDHGGKYPMDISTTNGGAQEMAEAGNAVGVLQILSNELSAPRIFYCPADRDHAFANNFSTNFSRQNISYFIGLGGDETNRPEMFLAGDDNFEIDGIPVKAGILQLSDQAPVAWSAARHKFSGNIGLADGSVQQTSQPLLKQLIQETGVATNRLAIP